MFLLLASLAACSDRPQIVALAPPAEIEHPGQMAVTGTATLEVAPDCADITMTLSADGVKPGDATKAVEAKEKALVDALTGLDSTKVDVKLGYLSLNPIYEPNPDGWAQIKVHTYRAEITVTATTHDFARIATLMELGADSGATSMSSAFRNSDLPGLKKKVRDMALAAAKDKAEQTAKALGIHLGRITAVAESPGGVMWSNAYFPQASNLAARENNGGGGVSIGGALQPLTLDVSISYELAKTI